MKKIVLLLIIPMSMLGQKPVRSYKFSSRATGIFTGDVSISPSGNLLLATFTDFKAIALYELIDLKNGKVISKGSLNGKPMDIAWSDDDKMAAISFTDKPPACFDVTGNMKKIFDCKESGAIAFTKNTSIMPGKKDPAFLYVFGENDIYKYNDKGSLIATYEMDGYNDFSSAWFHTLSKSFKLIGSGDAELFSFDLTGQKKTGYPLEDIGVVSMQKEDKDGSLYLYNNDNKVIAYDGISGKRIFSMSRKGIDACSFTPDSKTILIKIDDNLYLYDMKGNIISTVKQENYYSDMVYAGFGTELICINPEGVDIYACKNYMPVQVTNTPPVVKTPTPVVTPPVVKPVVKPVPVTENKPAKWNLPYTMTDFIVPLTNDSFYLYTSDRNLRYYILYKKTETALLWDNTYQYSQFFGFSNNPKFAQITTSVIELTNSEAIIRIYGKSGIIDKPQMLGFLGYLGKIPLEAGKTVSWPMKIYTDEQYTLSAKIIDNTYKGKKDKCLTVSRENIVSGKTSIETNFYQKGVGLIKIEVDGKVAFQR